MQLPLSSLSAFIDLTALLRLMVI